MAPGPPVCVCVVGVGCWGTDTCFYIKARTGHMEWTTSVSGQLFFCQAWRTQIVLCAGQICVFVMLILYEEIHGCVSQCV